MNKLSHKKMVLSLTRPAKNLHYSDTDTKEVEEFNTQNIVTGYLLSCQPRVTVKSCFVYKVIMDLESIDQLCINPICRIGLIHK